MKRMALRVWVLWVIFVLIGSVGSGARAAEPKLQVLCTVLPVYILTRNVVGNTPGVRVDLLLPPNLGCPHGYDLSPGEIRRLARPGAIVVNGLGLEETMEKTMKQAGPGTPIITATREVEPLARSGKGSPIIPGTAPPGDSSPKHQHRHPSAWNEHAWVSPKQAAVMVRTIAAGLAGIDPSRREIYRNNGDRYARTLESLHEEMKVLVSRAENKKVLTVHDSFDYWTRDLGLEVVGVIQPQPGRDPSPREMARLIGLIRKQKVKAILSEPQYSDKTARTLARETGVPVWSLDTVATGKAEPGTYEAAMKKNMETLRQALR